MKIRLLSARQISDWVQAAIKDPLAVSYLVEDKNPQVAKRIISYASQIWEPQSAGMGLRLKVWEDQKVVMQLPYRWRNRNRAGDVTLSSLTGASEVAMRLFFERHLDPESYAIHVQSATVTCFESLKEDLFLQVEVATQDLEDWLFKVQHAKDLHVEMEVPIFSEGGRRTALVQLGVYIKSQAPADKTQIHAASGDQHVDH